MEVSTVGRRTAPPSVGVGVVGVTDGEAGHRVLPVGAEHSEDPRLICDLLGYLRRKGALRPPQRTFS